MEYVLSIAGSDPCSGAGIQADIKTVSSLNAYGLSVITAITVQNTTGVRRSHPLAPGLVSAQLQALLEDIPVAAAKTGMLCNRAITEQVAQDWERHCLSFGAGSAVPPLVVDPVMNAQSGGQLLEPGAVDCLRERLLPLATIVTPNIAEAEILSGIKINGLSDMEEAGRQILRTGCSWVVVTGGHLPGACVDVALNRDSLIHFEGEHINSRNDHGTGCAFSAAISVFLARGEPVPDAIRMAKQYVAEALRSGFPPGRGSGVLNHFFGFNNQALAT